jgi:hypothetical protein
MPLNKLENFIKNYEGRILYVNSNDLDATDSITNQGNSLTKPFKTIQRALIESARFSYVVGDNNDYNARTTILVFPGEHVIDNRPGYGIRKIGTATAEAVAPNGNTISPASDEFTLTLESNFDITQEDNILYKFNSVNGGVILPRGTSLVGLDLRKTKIRPKYVPNPTDQDVPNSAIFRITGQCYFWQFSIFDANENELVYTNDKVFTPGSGNLSTPTFSHHKLTVFEYADGVNVPTGYDITDLDMYYAKLSNAFNEGSGRQIPAAQKFPLAPEAFTKERAEWEIVGAFAADPIEINTITSGDGATPSPTVSVTTVVDHGLTVGTPIKIRGVNVNDYNISTVVASVTGNKSFTYLLPFVRTDLPASPGGASTVTIETDTVKGSSPYIFNCSLRSVWGMNGMLADGKRSSGFRSMVVAQYTAVSLQKDDRAFVKYDPIARTYNGIPISRVTGPLLSSGSAATDNNRIYHLDQDAVYRTGWETTHVKITNDAILQIVSVFAIGFNKHFNAESGSDASITNSNSNFGQIALAADGFKKEAFGKDNRGYITSVISPKVVPPIERNFDWISIDVGLTTSVGISSHLYLFGFDTADNIPPNLIQGYRIGARLNDKLYLELPDGSVKDSSIRMTDNIVSAVSTYVDGEVSAVEEYLVTQATTAPNYEVLTLNQTHKLQNGEKVIILSDDGDLPENITEDRIYYTVITSNPNQIKLASSLTNAKNGTALKMYGGTNLRILSRVSDRDSGDLGSPIQYDPNHNNWFIHVLPNSELYSSIQSLGVVGFGEPRTDVTFFKRIADDRSLDEKVYKLRYVVPKEAPNAKDPSDGFIIQESSSTGALNNGEFSQLAISREDYSFKRNNRFISTCSELSGNVTVVVEQPHHLTTGDRVLIKNVRSSTNLVGFGVTGYNGDFVVTSTPDDKTFTHSIIDVDGITHNVGIFSGPSSRDTSLPRFERNDLQSNLYVYRSDVISPYEFGVQDGIYHLYVLNSSNAIASEFTNYKYSQNIVDLYPQLDRDNYDDNPSSAKSYAKRSPLGDVVTNDLKKSITRETIDIVTQKFGIGKRITAVSPSVAGIVTLTTALEHGFNGISGYATLSGGSGYNNGVYYNVKLLNNDDSWNGATASVTVSGGSVTDVIIQANGSGYSSGQTLKIDGFSGATIGITSSCISSPVNNSLQITGIGTAPDFLHRITGVPSKNEIAIARSTGDSTIYTNQYIFNVAPSTTVLTHSYNAVAGITTLSCASAHGLVAGNRFKVLDSSNNNLGNFVVNDVIGVSTVNVLGTIDPNANRILKHGFNANDLTSDDDGENLGARGISFYENESALLLQNIETDVISGIATFAISSYAGSQGNVGIATTTRFPIGSFVQIGNEIMRIASSTLSGSGSNEVVAIRGYLGTQKQFHQKDSIIRKIRPLPIELRRPSILRGSGHTFEYLGYGPGNYSTALPQIQNKTLTEREDFLAQSQERSAGQVIYTGMNSDGDFFIGNTKYSAQSGTQQTFDIPIPTITGQDPSRLSVVFDEVIVKERILVEGGKSKQILSQFDGPVTFNENIIFNDEIKINDILTTTSLVKHNNETQSTSFSTGSVVIKGGLGVYKDVNIKGNVGIGSTVTFNGDVLFNAGLIPARPEIAFIGIATAPWGAAWHGGIGIATEGVPGGTEVKDRTIDAWTGDLVLSATRTGIVSVADKLEVTDDLLVKGNTYLTGIATVATGLVPDADVDAFLGTEALSFAEAYIDDVRVGVSSIGEIDTVVGNLVLDSNTNLVIVDANLQITGNSEFNSTTTFGDIITVNTGIVPDTDEGAYIGVSTLPFSEAHIGEIRIANAGNDNEIDTATGNLILDSASGMTVIDDRLTINEYLTVTGVSTFTGVIDANDGATIDDVQIGRSGNNEIDTSSGNLILDSTGGTVIVDDNLDVNLTLNVDSTSLFNDTVTIKGSSKSFRVQNNSGTNKFTVASDSGNTDIQGTLNVEGDTTIDDAMTVTGIFDITNTTQSTSTTSGSFQTDGGAGIAKNLYVGGNTNLGATLTVSSTATFNSTTTFNGNVDAGSNTITAQTFSGQAENADKLKTVSTSTNSYHYLTFVDSNNGTATNEIFYTDAGIYYNPSDNELFVTGDITAFASDIRLKKDIEPIENALDKVLKLNGFTYSFNEIAAGFGFNTETRHSGVSAQDVQAVLPEAVVPTPASPDYLTVKYEKIVPLLIEAIKELSDKVEKLEQKLSDK